MYVASAGKVPICTPVKQVLNWSLTGTRSKVTIVIATNWLLMDDVDEMYPAFEYSLS